MNRSRKPEKSIGRRGVGSRALPVCAALLLTLAAPSAGRAADAAVPQPVEAQAPQEYTIGFLPGDHLFKSLVADPRWPHFGLAYQSYLDDPNLGNVGAVSFGESFILYRDAIGAARWEAGIQAGVFAFFDLDKESSDLVNADYVGALVLGCRYGRFSALGRLFHQSSHLGDEYVLSDIAEDRVNLSYEAVDLRLSYELFGDAVRLIGGVGNIFDREPTSLDPWSLETGLELRSPWPGGRFRPVVAADVQYREENEWAADVSLRAGFELQRWLGSRKLQVLAEYFQGHSPNGQFYKDNIEYLGLGLHFNF